MHLITKLQNIWYINPVIIGYISIHFSVINRTSRKKINKDIEDFKKHCQCDLVDIYRTFYPKTVEYTFFSSAHGIFTKVDHILGDKTNHNKFLKIQGIQSLCSSHKIKLEINYRKVSEKSLIFVDWIT